MVKNNGLFYWLEQFSVQLNHKSFAPFMKSNKSCNFNMKMTITKSVYSLIGFQKNKDKIYTEVEL